jgi:hypothetical protein
MRQQSDSILISIHISIYEKSEHVQQGYKKESEMERMKKR